MLCDSVVFTGRCHVNVIALIANVVVGRSLQSHSAQTERNQYRNFKFLVVFFFIFFLNTSFLLPFSFLLFTKSE